VRDAVREREAGGWRQCDWHEQSGHGIVPRRILEEHTVMWKALKSLLDERTPAGGGRPRPELAGLALLLEIARADHNSTPEERKAVVAAAAHVFDLDGALAEALIVEAETAVEEAVSLFEFTDVLNATLDAATKSRLLEQLWRVAYADGSVARYEEYYLRKIADLLHLPHRELIRTKLAAAAS
jgi:uncharacterized tellurite resistance protein B-like protein